MCRVSSIHLDGCPFPRWILQFGFEDFVKLSCLLFRTPLVRSSVYLVAHHIFPCYSRSSAVLRLLSHLVHCAPFRGHPRFHYNCCLIHCVPIRGHPCHFAVIRGFTIVVTQSSPVQPSPVQFSPVQLCPVSRSSAVSL